MTLKRYENTQQRNYDNTFLTFHIFLDSNSNYFQKTTPNIAYAHGFLFHMLYTNTNITTLG